MISNVTVKTFGAMGLLFLAVLAADGLRGPRHAYASPQPIVCASPATELAKVFREFYQVAAVSDRDEVWIETRSQLGLSGRVDSSLVVLESRDSACTAALKLYRQYFPAGPDARVLVANVDTVRAISILEPGRDADTTANWLGVRIHLIANADLSAVVDTIWY